MEKYSSFENYDKLMNKLKSIKNPEAFYEFVSKNELTKDLTYNSDMFYSQSEFNRFVSDVLGEEVEDGEDIVKDFMDFKYESYKGDEIDFTDSNLKNHTYKYSLISRTGKIVSKSDSRQTLINIIMNSNDSDIANGYIQMN